MYIYIYIYVIAGIFEMKSTLKKDETGKAVQSWLPVRVEFMVW